MKWRVVHVRYLPAYFRTKKEAFECRAYIGGEVQRKIGEEWVTC